MLLEIDCSSLFNCLLGPKWYKDMYEFPKRITQHKNETKALVIFLYHLKDFGIVRDIRENDYGIDLEYEFVIDDNVIGRAVKIQLKSVSKINKKNPKIWNL